HCRAQLRHRGRLPRAGRCPQRRHLAGTPQTQPVLLGVRAVALGEPGEPPVEALGVDLDPVPATGRRSPCHGYDLNWHDRRVESTPLADLVVKRLVAAYGRARDPERAAPMRAYMRDQFPFLGIPTPARRQLSREVLAGVGRPTEDDLRAAALACWRLPERE